MEGSDMKRAVLDKPNTLKVMDSDAPRPGPGEALVKVMRCGVCGSDIHSYTGRHPLTVYPVTPGHEFSGIVTEVGDRVDRALEGARVCVEPSLTCGRCPQCLSGRYNICGELKVMGFQAPGAFCELIAVPAEKVHLLPGDVGFDAGALAEPLAVGVHALRRSGAGRGDSALIIGAGVIGLMVLTAARASGIDALVAEPDAARADTARALGATRVFPGGRHSSELISAVSEAGVGFVFECVGLARTADMAVRLAPRGSTLVVAGVFPGPVPVPLDLVQDGELDIRGTLMYMAEDFELALGLLGDGLVDTEALITHSVPLEQLERGYNIAIERRPPTLKVMVRVGEEA